MPEWGWCIAIFVALTMGYLVVFAGGCWKSDAAPSPGAWRAVREYSIDAQKVVNIHGIDAQHEEEMALIQRGVYDNLDFSGGVEITEEDGGNA